MEKSEKKGIVYLDLFAGVGGFAEGINRAGIKVRKHYYSEVDKYAKAVYQHHFKEAKDLGDVRTVCRERLSERPNLITFGFPCQDLSVAGKGEGLSGSRSSLFYEAIRIIEEVQPEIFVFENVKGLLSSNNGEDFELVLRTIANLGIYDCEWQLLNTKWLLPQNRERVYFIGHRRGRSRPQVFPFLESNKRTSEGKPKPPVVRALTVAGNSGGMHSGMTLITNFQGKDYCNTLRGSGGTTLSDKHNYDTIRIHSVLTPDRAEKRQNGRRFKSHNEPAFTLNTQDQHGILIRSNTFLGNDLLMVGDSLNLSYPNSKSKRGRIGHGCVHTLDTSCNQAILSEAQLRRLTPIECERLQGFKDDWTKYGLVNEEQVIISNSQRYKQMGNAVTVDVVEMVVMYLKKQIAEFG